MYISKEALRPFSLSTLKMCIVFQVFHVEDVVEMTGHVLDEDSPYSLKQSQLVQVCTYCRTSFIHVSFIFVKKKVC